MKQIEAIKFATNWKQRGSQPGGKIFKRNFLQRLFDHVTEHVSLHKDGNEAKRRAFKKVFNGFKAWHRKVIMARNYLCDLYEQVCELDQFTINIRSPPVSPCF